MNTTLLISKKPKLVDTFFSHIENYRSIHSQKISILLLHDINNTDEMLHESIVSYTSFGTKNVIVAKSDGTAFNKKIAAQFSDIQFFCLNQNDQDSSKSRIANIINKVFHTLKSDKIFISWTDIDPYGMSLKALEKDVFNYSLCTVPVLEDESAHSIPSVYVPKLVLGSIKVKKNTSNAHIPYTLLPDDYIGMYDREDFLKIGGFNNTILDPWVQLFDFGLRCYKNKHTIELSVYYRIRKNKSKRESFLKKNTLEMYDACMRESIGNNFLYLFKSLFIDIRHIIAALTLMMHSKEKSVVSFKNIIKEYWDT